MKKKREKVKNTYYSYIIKGHLVCLGSKDPGYRYLLCSLQMSIEQKKLYTNSLTSYFGIIPANNVKYILGIFVRSSPCHSVQIIQAAVSE